MPRDFSAVIPVQRPTHSTLNPTAIDTAEAAVITWMNTNNPVGFHLNDDGTLPTLAARPAVLTGGNAWTAPNSDTTFFAVALYLANNGTSTKTNYGRQTFTTPVRGTTAAEVIDYALVIKLLSDNGVNARMYARQYAQSIFSYAKAQGLEFRVGVKAGIDSKYAYCGFDTSIYVTGMNTHERAAADATFQTAIARAQGGETRVSDAVELTKGIVRNPARTIMF